MNIESTLIKHWITSMLVGEAPKCKIRGTAKQLTALMEALVATWQFNKDVNESCSVPVIMETLKRKHVAVNNFEKHFKMKWPI